MLLFYAPCTKHIPRGAIKLSFIHRWVSVLCTGPWFPAIISQYMLNVYVYGICTYVGAADTFQEQAGDLRLPVELALGHAQLLLCLRREDHTRKTSAPVLS